METMVVHIYGDSLMRGTVMDARGRYHATVAPLLADFEERFNAKVNNRARFGSTIQKGADIVTRDINNGARCDVALLEFGGNDCDFRWDEVAAAPDAEHRPHTVIEDFRTTLKGMLMALKSTGARPVLMTLPPIDAGRYLDHISQGKSKANILQWLGDAQMIYRFQELYSMAVAQIAQETATKLIDVRSAFLARRDCARRIGADGIHLVEEGYALLYETIARQAALSLA